MIKSASAERMSGSSIPSDLRADATHVAAEAPPYHRSFNMASKEEFFVGPMKNAPLDQKAAR